MSYLYILPNAQRRAGYIMLYRQRRRSTPVGEQDAFFTGSIKQLVFSSPGSPAILRDILLLDQLKSVFALIC